MFIDQAKPLFKTHAKGYFWKGRPFYPIIQSP